MSDPSVVFQQMCLFSARDSLDSGPVMLGQSSALCKLDSGPVMLGQSSALCKLDSGPVMLGQSSALCKLDSGPVMLGQSSALCKLDSSSVTQGQSNGCVCFGSPREKAMLNTSWSVFRQRSENILAEVLEEFTDINKQVPHAMTKINYNQLFTKFNEVFVTYYLW